MFFAVDIDGVLARDVMGYATYLNRYFQLGIEQSVLDTLSGYTEFLELEAVRAFVRGNTQRAAEFNQAAKEAQYAPLVQQMRVPVPGAVEAVRTLAERSPFRYVTCRRAATLNVTQEWLERYHFPAPENVSCCEQGIHQKYLVAYQIADAGDQLIFIDDLASTLMTAFAALIKYHYQEAQVIRKRSVLLAFGHTEAPAWPFRRPLYPVYALPDWSAFADLKDETRLLFA